MIDNLDILSIDLDGNDYWIVEAADLHEIQVLGVEYNPLFVRQEIVGKIELPVPSDISRYTDWRIRESRDSSGKLNYISGSDRLEQIKHLPLKDVINRIDMKVIDII